MTEERTEGRIAWDEVVAALQRFIDSVPNDDLPNFFHVVVRFENANTHEVLRYYPVRMGVTARRPPKAVSASGALVRSLGQLRQGAPEEEPPDVPPATR